MFQVQVMLLCDATKTFNCQDQTRSSKLQGDASTGAEQKLHLLLWRKTVSQVWVSFACFFKNM